MALAEFSAPTRSWFESNFDAPTNAQRLGWPAIAKAKHTLILAPTGSGKTLSAFLWAIDRLMTEPVPAKLARTRVIYISPLRALAVDVDKNLRSPLRGIHLAAAKTDIDLHEPTVGVRTGDTPPAERQRLIRTPPDILITTPESLYLMLTSKARETLANVETVIIDEIHAIAATKRGSHLALTLERLEQISHKQPQRIGLSATQRPLEEIARFLGGMNGSKPRPVSVVDAGSAKKMEIEVVIPVANMAELPVEDESGKPARSIWPSIHPRLLQLILSHRSTLLFCNYRGLAERLAANLNELYLESLGDEIPDDPELVKAHHGSISREQRLVIEDQLKSGKLRALVATSSLELGIDMGAVDLVLQVESPGSVSRGMQRIGRAGHQVGAPSVGKIFPKHRGDLLETAVVVRRMLDGDVESTRYPRNPLDVLAQQLVAMCAMDEWDVEELLGVVRNSAPFSDLAEDVFYATLDMLSGRYPSDDFSELRPRLVWDRLAGTVRGRQGAQRLAVTNPGTIPDRGLFGVFMPDGTRVGELDEEMVYESRVGETFRLGASAWRITEISFDRVIVQPAPGEQARMPFWHGDGPGRPLELGRAIGKFTRELLSESDEETQLALLRDRHRLDELAAKNLLNFLGDQTEATGSVPDDRTIVVEQFCDEIGDWRVCILTPFGNKVHAPWGTAICARLEERYGQRVEMLWADDGIVIRLPESADGVDQDDLFPDPELVEEMIVAQLPGTALFASRFREIAGRALLLPRRRPGQRTPLWQQRQRAAGLLEVASRYPSFPMLLETVRECLQEVFDLPALLDVLSQVRDRRLRVVFVETASASPFAQSLLMDWIAIHVYDGDAPLAERRAAALSLDRGLLQELLGAEELRELIDPEVLAALELELQRLADGYRARHEDDLHDLLRTLGPLVAIEIEARCEGDAALWIESLQQQHRLIELSIAGDDRYVAVEDAGRLRDAIGSSLPQGLPTVFTEPVVDAALELVARYARTHGPFLAENITRMYGLLLDEVVALLAELVAGEKLLVGEFRPGGSGREYCDPDVLRSLRRRSLAVLRSEVEPVDAQTFARFLPAWHGLEKPAKGADALLDAVDRLQGVPLVASVLEASLLPARVDSYNPAELDGLISAGELLWTGIGSLGVKDGRIILAYRDRAALLISPPEAGPEGDIYDSIRDHLSNHGASFWPDLVVAVGSADEEALLSAIWDLVWAGELTNDTLAPLRAFLGGKRRTKAKRSRHVRLTRLGPPMGAGRWSLVRPLLEPRPTSTERSYARAMQLLERHGIVTREGALAEKSEGGFAGIYGVLRALEDRGLVRRGYFVAGQGAAQFALPGAIDRLRSYRGLHDAGEVIVVAATDPAQPYGATLAWPETGGNPARAAGAHVVLLDGRPLVFLDRAGRSLTTFEGAAENLIWIEALRGLEAITKLELSKINGESWTDSDFTQILLDAGAKAGYRGPLFR